jgi:hypothetical protein
VQSALDRLGNGCCSRKREAPVVKRGRKEVLEEAASGVRPEPEEEPRTTRAKGLKRVTNIFTAVEEPEGSKGEESEEE